MTDSSNITLGFERGTAFYIGQSQIVRSSMFLLRGFFSSSGVVITTGKKKGRRKKERTMRTVQGGCAHTSAELITSF